MSGGEADPTRTLQLFLETATQGIVSVDADGTILTVNRALENMFGWAPGELLGQSIERLVPAPLGALHAQHRAGYFKAPRPRPMGQGLELVGARQDGTTFPIEVSLNHVPTPVGGRAIAVVTDITARVRAAAALRENERRLQLTLDAARAATWSENVQTGQLDTDDRGRQRLGLGVDEPISIDAFLARVHPDDVERVRSTVDAVRGPHGPAGWDFEHRLIQPDGQVAWHRSVAHAERDAAGGCLHISAIAMDVTLRKTAEEEVQRSHTALRQRASELEQRSRQLQRLATALTLTEQQTRELMAKALHDGLQQLLFSARLRVAGVSSARPGLAPGTAKALDLATEDLDEAIAAARSLAIELFPPALHERGLPAALEWLAGWMRTKYELSVQVTADPAADPERKDTRVLLFEAVRELLFNVVKHVGATAEARVDLAAIEGHALCITVSDNGPGIDPDAAFGHPDNPRVGLGLFSIRERLALVGGSFEIIGTAGRGARLRLLAPRYGGSTVASAGTAVAETTTAGDETTHSLASRPITVLIVDDHASVREGLTEMLRPQAGIAVIGEAVNGLDAIAQARVLQPDAIVMDVSMPGMNGIEATRRIHAEFPTIQIFGFSTQERMDDLHAIEKAGAAGYFTKDADAEHLVARLRAVRTRA
ncbi:MAG: response regulator [Dehalococcoidia bacterium]